MKQVFSLVAISFLIFTQACSAQRNNGNTSENRSIEDYTELNISGGFRKATLRKGAPSVRVIAEDRFLPYIITENEGKALSIYFKKGAPRDIEASLEITFSKLSEINNSGSTDIEVTDPITGQHLELNYSGSGNLKAEMEVEHLEVAISGSSDMTLRGNASKQDYAISGSGDIHAEQLRGENASVAISGSGDVDLNVSGNVRTSSSGSGNVRNRN
jgi:hypothetical protein